MPHGAAVQVESIKAHLALLIKAIHILEWTTLDRQVPGRPQRNQPPAVVRFLSGKHMETTHEAQRAFEQFLFCGGIPETLGFHEGPGIACLGAASYVPPIISRKERPTPTAPEIGPALNGLAHKMATSIVLPLHRAQTREEFSKIFQNRWNEFRAVLDAMRTLVTSVSSEELATALAGQQAEANIKDLGTIAEEMGGADAAGEVRFATQTYLSALRIAGRIREPDAPLSDDLAKHDSALSMQFSIAAALHTLGALLLIDSLHSRPTNVALDGAFGLLRAGATEAYAAAREAYELRRPAQQPMEFLPFDDEDFALADSDNVEP